MAVERGWKEYGQCMLFVQPPVESHDGRRATGKGEELLQACPLRTAGDPKYFFWFVVVVSGEFDFIIVVVLQGDDK